MTKEKELVVKQELIDKLNTYPDSYYGGIKGYLFLRNLIDGLDSKKVKFTFCKDCRYLGFHDCYGVCTKNILGIVNPYDFCSRGDNLYE